MEHLLKGAQAEERAAAFLISKGYHVMEKNYRNGKGEIDIICWKKPFIVFVEVKYRKNNSFGYPEEFVDDRKLNMIKKTAVRYVLEKKYEGPVRYDVIAITGNESPIHFEDV